MPHESIAHHYAQLIGLKQPWQVSRVEVSHSDQEVRIFVVRAARPRLRCPECGVPCGGYDTRERRWRHLDTMQYRTFLIAEVPRVQCEEHGVRQIAVPWSDPGSRFTALFEALVIDWLREANVRAIARRLRLSWEQVAGIQARAVKRGLARRTPKPPRQIGVDETAFQKRHEYVTVVHDIDEAVVIHVADDRKQEALEAYFEGLGPDACAALEHIAMDMWAPYIAATRARVPDADAKIVFDKFHIAKHLGDAVDQVRRRENRELVAEGSERLKRTKYLWLQNPDRMSPERWREFGPLRDSRLKVARAWAIKEAAMLLWGYVRRGWAERLWERWYRWAIRSRLEPVKRVARMIKKHWEGVINAATTPLTNARAEAINSRIQWVKRMACGYRNRENFRHAIYFHLGGLDLYP
ncbi:MAG: ISL3 family transposase, partial [Thermoanaerobaculia bacterium]